MITSSCRLIAFALLSLVFLSPAAVAKKENAPGLQKKILTISALVVDVSPYSVALSWSTNLRADTAISVTEITTQFPNDGVIHYDPTLTKEHQMLVSPLIPGRNYEYEVISTDLSGQTVRSKGNFSTPSTARL
jgi:hypothetical protein